MTANTKSMLLLALTLITGFSLGLFADASLVRGRRDRIRTCVVRLGSSRTWKPSSSRAATLSAIRFGQSWSKWRDRTSNRFAT
jgi:hypothetical protein